MVWSCHANQPQWSLTAQQLDDRTCLWCHMMESVSSRLVCSLTPSLLTTQFPLIRSEMTLTVCFLSCVCETRSYFDYALDIEYDIHRPVSTDVTLTRQLLSRVSFTQGRKHPNKLEAPQVVHAFPPLYETKINSVVGLWLPRRYSWHLFLVGNKWKNEGSEAKCQGTATSSHPLQLWRGEMVHLWQVKDAAVRNWRCSMKIKSHLNKLPSLQSLSICMRIRF